MEVILKGLDRLRFITQRNFAQRPIPFFLKKMNSPIEIDSIEICKVKKCPILLGANVICMY